jgi:hypothetical protein
LSPNVSLNLKLQNVVLKVVRLACGLVTYHDLIAKQAF